ncbi:MAG TPA: gliding motility-associated C-terminal domain-containing protein [Bacteroidales bacterium]|nr:gliding motility-associated C-terminal domain-containing protein [Bacteroidales bacterium]
MKAKQEIPFREKFGGFSITPSPEVWKKIEAAKPSPLIKPGYRWMAVTGAAAVIVVTLWWVFRTEVPVPASGPLPDHNGYTQIPGPAAPAGTPHLKDTLQDQNTSSNHAAGQISPVDANITAPATTQTPPALPAAGNATTPSVTNQAPSTSISGTTPSRPAETTVKAVPEAKANQGQPLRTPAKIVASDPVNDSTGGNTNNDRLEVFIPNAFAPGTTGPNSIFKPVVKNNAPVREYKMQVFSRAGLLLFESDDVETGWDGRFDGDIVNDQVCAYIITFRDEAGFPYARKGTITLIR